MVSDTAQPSSLSEAMLLAGTGGLLDSFVFLNHGHVFANAMTGNIIFLGIAVLGHQWSEVVPHFVPILGFFAGVTASRHLRSSTTHAAVLSLTFEILALFALSWAPADFPSMVFTGIIACVAALQVASFRRVDRFSFNSTFITGNLRDAVEGLYDTLAPLSTPEVREKGGAQVLYLSLICLCFLAGVVLGAWSSPRLANHTLWLAEPLLLAVAIHLLRSPAKFVPQQR